MFGDIGKLDYEDEEVDVKTFDAENYSLDYDTIFRCYNRALTIAQRGNLDDEDFKDEFYDELLNNGCPTDEADEIVENFNPA